MSQRRKRKKEGECTYCGNVAILTEDHVIPQCLFPKPLPQDIVKVPACFSCNNAKSKDDDFLRDFLVTDVFASEHPIAKSIFHGKVLSSARQNKSAFIRLFKTNARYAPLHSHGGIYLGHAFAVTIDGVRLTNIFCRITKGLYRKIRNQRIPDNYECFISRWQANEFEEAWPKLKQLGINGPYRCGSIFTCLMLYDNEDPFITMWWLWFFDSICIHVRTAPPDFNWEATSEAA